MEDSKIIELYWNRNEQAIQETASTYGKKLEFLSLGILKNKEDSNEAVNDTYLKTWNAIPPQKPLYFFAFLSKICRNICFGILDYQKAQKRNFEVVTLSNELENCIPSNLFTVEIRDETLGKILSTFLQSLSADSRTIFLRRYWYCDSIHDIATHYNLSESKVKTSLHRSRKKLKTYLEKEGISL